MATAATALRMPEDLAVRYEKLAKSTGRTKTFYMNEALADSIDRLEYEYGLLQQVEDYRSGKLETYSLEEVRQHCGLAD
jgi:RHH-type rel operon transcriptional repressor/antitoxin RelB